MEKMINSNSIYNPKLPSIIKRIGAFILDFIIFLVIATGIMYLMSIILDYDSTLKLVESKYLEYGIKILDENNNGIIQEDLKLYNQGWELFQKDNDAMNAFSLMHSKIIIMVIISLIIPSLVNEIVFPLIFKNGKSLGRFVMKIALINKKDIKASFINVFTRFLFGKLVYDLLIPAFCLLLIYFGNNNIILYGILLFIILSNLYCLLGSKLHQTMADYFGMVYKCESDGQVFFETIEELNKAKGKEAIIKNNKKEY